MLQIPWELCKALVSFAMINMLKFLHALLILETVSHCVAVAYVLPAFWGIVYHSFSIKYDRS